MSLVYVTGPPGIGKSTIEQGLSKLGFEAHDLDAPVFGGPHNKATGERVAIPPATERPSDWFDRHEWRIYVHEVKKLRDRAANEKNPVFLCGVAQDDEEILPYFDKVIYLRIDDNTLVQRLAYRNGNDYGKNATEIEAILQRKLSMDKKYSSLNAIYISAAKKNRKPFYMT